MIKLERTSTFNLEGAIRGMRNAFNSWDQSDSGYVESMAVPGKMIYEIGKNDLDLMKKLAKAGSDHRKYMRQIFVSVDITAPIYWWKEFDTYKVGTVANSTSTMHTIHKKEFTMDDFSHEHLWGKAKVLLEEYIIPTLNDDRECYLESKNKDDWWQMIQLLPSSYNQKRTVTMNYENLVNMYHARKNHKLNEWHEFCDWIKELPYSEIITGDE